MSRDCVLLVQLRYTFQQTDRERFNLHNIYVLEWSVKSQQFFFSPAVQKCEAERGYIIMVQKRVSKARNVKGGGV